MNCHAFRQYWNLYHDSEGTPDLFQQINAHLESCRECADWYRGQDALEDELTRRVSAGEATPQLWDSLLESTVKPPTVRSAPKLMLSLLAVLAAGIIVAVGIAHWPQPVPLVEQPDLAELTAQQHRALLGGNQLVDFRSSSDLEVEAYLRDRVEFPVRCPPRKDTGFMVSGAGTCRFDGQKAAYLVGKLDGSDVSIFILSRDALRRFSPPGDLLRRDRRIDCRRGDDRMAMAAMDKNLVLIIGGSSCTKLERVLHAYGTYPHDDSG